MDFIIELAQEQARLRSGTALVQVKGKELQFICTLIGTEPDLFVNRAAIHRLPGWSHMAPASVGKQLARLIARWTGQGIDAIECYKKTDGWRLRTEVRASLSADAVAMALARLEHLTSQSWQRIPDVVDADLSSWACQSVSAMLAMTEGRADPAYDAVKSAYGYSANPVLRDIANVLATRIGQRFPDPHEPVLPEARFRASGLDLAFAARRLAAYAIRTQSDRWQIVARELEQMLSRLMEQSDFTSQAIVLNALALLHRRLKDFDRARDYAREAMPLAVFSGDIILTQNVMFNLGNILSDRNRQASSAQSPDMFLRLLAMDIEIRNRLGVGKDSAQTDLLLAYLHYENGDLDNASKYLEQAEAIIEVNRSRADAALALRIKGLILLTHSKVSGLPSVEGVAILQRAAAEYLAIGNNPAAEYVMSELSELARS